MLTSAKNVLVGISGGIAAYKTMFLIRLLAKEGYNVKVVATPNALQFVTLTTIETLSQNKCLTNVFEPAREYSTEHIALAKWADVMVVAPATANVLGKFAAGIADDALSTLYLAFAGDVLIAPAMNSNMYLHSATQANMQTLQQRGVRFIQPEKGTLACGDEGVGRMAEPETILNAIEEITQQSKPLSGKTVVVSAGPTYEKIDAVRFIGNFSSGLMGFCLAEEAARQGANTILITGPTHLKTTNNHITRIDVVSSADMLQACREQLADADVFIMSAAVADYTPEQQFSYKLKKQDQELNIRLKPTVDVLRTLGERKQANQMLVGFALETDNEVENAKKKIRSKNLDFVVLNSLRDKDAGFGVETNKITIIDKDDNMTVFPTKPKTEVAKDIIDTINQKLSNR
ncbi:MAG: bifunctional phosphopantothenoylcysteine decarboxylase/phosphopantothenate--cysteine ligase CoaBC [Bacteroidales bacterium]|nr:bifunctional phosphopantothenoylcysteine decarboxylase/phosphopantothenate--cysteine ligase CoaBC [Bacteroidales bacterium]